MPSARPLLPALFPLLLSAATTLLCLRATGPTAGLFFGGVAFATLIIPPLTTRENPLSPLIAVFVGTSAVWLVTLNDQYVTAPHWLRATAVLGACCAALAGASAATQRTRLPFPIGPAIIVVASSLWLTWPIWLSPHLPGHETLVGRLVIAHPLMAIDGALDAGDAALGPPWTERPLMYNELTNLNQDVAYALPATVTWAVLLHGAIGCAGFALSRFRTTSKEDSAFKARAVQP